MTDANATAVSTGVAKTATASEAPSPFLPGTNVQFAWDSTSLGYLKTCPRLYYYHMIEGWRGKGENIHLRFGIEYHQALQDYDVSRARGIKHVDAVHDTLRCLLGRIVDWEPIASEGKRSEELKTKPALIRTVLWYLDKFEDDPAQTVILENGKPAVEVSFRFEMRRVAGENAEIARLRRDCAELYQVVGVLAAQGTQQRLGSGKWTTPPAR